MPAVEPLEGRALMSVAPSQVIFPIIGINSASAPHIVPITNPQTFQIFVLSQAGPTPFVPVHDLLPGSIQIDGIPARTASIRPDLIDQNGDGIQDAIITITLRSPLHLTPGTNVLGIGGSTRYTVHGARVFWEAATTVEAGLTGEGLPTANQYVNGFITINNATPNTYRYTVVNYYPLGGSPNIGTSAPFFPGTPVTINTGPGFFGPSFFIQVAITVGGNRLPPATFGYQVLSTSPNVISQFNLIINNQGQLQFVRA
jgi:hypothetical protein